MVWTDNIKTGVLDWLLEEDDQAPSVRYLALKDLLDRSENEGKSARHSITL
jgi:hypothetical protein